MNQETPSLEQDESLTDFVVFYENTTLMNKLGTVSIRAASQEAVPDLFKARVRSFCTLKRIVLASDYEAKRHHLGKQAHLNDLFYAFENEKGTSQR